MAVVVTTVSRDARAAAQGGAALVALQTVSRVLALGFVLVATRHLGADEFGRYSIAASLVLMGNLFADFGTTPAITKLVSRDPNSSDRLLKGTLVTSLALGLLAAAGVVGFATLSAYPRPVLVDIAIAATGIPAASVASSIAGALDGRGLIARRAGVSLLQSLTVAVGGTVAVMTSTGIRGAVVALAAGPFVALVASGLLARRKRLWQGHLRLDMPATRQVLRAALPFAVIMGCTAFSARFDVVLLSLTGSRAETATYDLAQRLMESLWYISAAITGPTLFLLSRRLGEEDLGGAHRAVVIAARVLYVLALPVSLVLLVFARPVIELALGGSYAASARPFAILAVGLCLVFVTQVQMAVVNAGDHRRRAARNAVLVAAVTVVLDLALVPTFGSTGAAVSVVASSAVAVAVYGRLVRQTVGEPFPMPPLPALAAAGAMLAPVLLLRTLPVAAIAVGLGTYAVTLLALGGLTQTDIARLRAAFSRTGT